MNLDDRDDRIEAAAGYVIGTLEAADRVAVERAVARDPAFAREVGWWRDRLLPLVRLVAPVQPSPAVWRRIESAVVNGERRAERDARVPLLARLGFWRGLAIAATAALVVVSVRGLLPLQTEVGPRYVAVLETPEKRAGWVLEARPDGKVRAVPVGPQTVASDRVLELWTRVPGVEGVRSLGLLAADRPTEIDVARLPRIARDQHFAISLEPAGGSPVSQPTGPVLFAGDMVVADAGR